MPFIGVLPERAQLFQQQPTRAVGVNDAAAWRLNPDHRRIYDKLWLALDAGLTAAPCGVSPMDLGVAPETVIFVKPITNLAGMGLDARAVQADAVPVAPGCFWCERLEGTHTSSDCLVRNGEVIWFAHTRASDQKDQSRPLYWQVGVDLPEHEPWLRDWVARNLKGYTGLCNLELIGGRPIEAHLRGSNGFFDFYGPAFLPAWVALIDGAGKAGSSPSGSGTSTTDTSASDDSSLDRDGREPPSPKSTRPVAELSPAMTPPPPVPGGLIMSVFGEVEISPAEQRDLESRGIQVQIDRHTLGRSAILRTADVQAGFQAYRQLTGITP